MVYPKESQDHGITKGMPFRQEWCCKTSDIWDTEDEGPPCSICPMNDFEPDPFNIFCLERWKYLDLLGRDRGFGEMPLREEAIDLHLRRYHANTQDIYETVVRIEIILFGDRSQKEKKKKESEDKKRKAKAAKGAGKQMIPRRTATMNRK